jgi:hypothetical protein
MAKQSRITSDEAKAAKKAAKPLNPCGDGCGQQVARNFAPGHDQRHKGALRRAFDAGSAEAEAELLDRGWNTQEQLDNRRAEAKAKAERAAERESAKAAKAKAATTTEGEAA